MKFSDLETKDDASLINNQSSPLTDWYRSIRNVPIAEMELGDLCRAIRQRLFIAHVLPVAVTSLATDVLAGDDYEGQLLSSLKVLIHDDWTSRVEEAQRTDKVLRTALGNGQLTPELERDALSILAAISGLPPAQTVV
jgi:hypothetical protein